MERDSKIWGCSLRSSIRQTGIAERARSAWFGLRDLPETEHGEERFVDPPQLFGAEVSGEITETVGVDCAKLLNQHSCAVAGNVDLRSEGSGTRRTRRWSNEHHRSWQELVGLNDYTESISVLLVPDTLAQVEPEDVTP